MNLRGIVAVSGRPGLFKLVGQNKAGYVLESLDAQKVKIVANISNTKLASLEDITVYGEDDDIKLSDVLANITTQNDNVPDIKADANQLKSFFLEVAPNHDQDKVYVSDMKKIVSWYNILKELPIFTEEAPALDEQQESMKADLEKKSKAANPVKPANVKAPSKTNQPAKKANMTSKKGV